MNKTHKKNSPNLVVTLCLFVAGLSLWPAQARSQLETEPTFHWAYASFFGTGWYKINDERSAFIIRAAPRWSSGEAGIDAEGNRSIAYTFRTPITLGLSKLDFDDIPGIIDPDNVATGSIGFSVDADIPVTRRFSLRPSAELGHGTILGESGSAWTYKAELRSQYTFQSGKLDWALLGGLGYVGFNPNRGHSDDFAYLAAGMEFAYPVSWPRSSNGQTMLYWHATYTDFLDEIDFKTGIRELDSVGNFWQFGLALGRRDKPVKIWFLKFDRLGLAYNYSATGELRGIKFVFRSLYEL